MYIIHSTRRDNPIDRLSHALVPDNMEVIRQGFIDGCGIETYKPGAECDHHFHDSDEYWFILDGQFHVLVGDEEEDVGKGTIVFTPMGVKHQITALTEATVLWLHGEMRGQKRPGHLHDDD